MNSINCPLCNTKKFTKETILFSDLKKKAVLLHCTQCGLSYLQDIYQDRKMIYEDHYSVWSKDEKDQEQLIERAKKSHFIYLLKKLNRYTSFQNKSLLDIGTGKGYLLETARTLGIREVYGLEISNYASRIAQKKFPGRIFHTTIQKLQTKKRFDIITLTDLVEHLSTIKKDFEKIHSLLRPGGIILITTPDTDSFTRKLYPKTWFQYKYEHVIYFNNQSMQHLLHKYNILVLKNNSKKLNMGYYRLYLKKYSSPLIAGMFPKILDPLPLKNPFLGEMLVIAKKK